MPGNLYLSQQQTEQDVKSSNPEPFVPARRLVHFDLKGAPPKIDYLKKVMDIAVKLGATGLLIEYEDMFPYEGVLEPLAAHNHYTKTEVNRKQILVSLC